MRLPLKVWLIILAGVSLTVAVFVVDFFIAPGSVPEIIERGSVWLMIYSILFILIVPLWLLKKIPISLRLTVLFFPGLLIFFGGASRFTKGVFLSGIDLECLFFWCMLGSLVVSTTCLITYSVRRKKLV